MFAIKVDQPADIFAGVNGALGGLPPVMSSFAVRLYQSIMENFSVGGRPAWAPLTPEYLARKARAGYPPDILVRTGALRGSVTVSSGPLSVTANSDSPYAGVHQLGAPAGSRHRGAPAGSRRRGGYLQTTFPWVIGAVAPQALRRVARPFLTMTAGDEDELARMVADYITGANR